MIKISFRGLSINMQKQIIIKNVFKAANQKCPHRTKEYELTFCFGNELNISEMKCN